MHERQVAWLDGKPENVLCTGHSHSSSLRITICDFGCGNQFGAGKTRLLSKYRHELLCEFEQCCQVLSGQQRNVPEACWCTACLPATPNICHRCALLADPEVCIDEYGWGGTPDYLAPEMVIAAQLFQATEDLDDLNGNTRNVIAADAWAAGAVIFFAATGDTLAEEDPEIYKGTDDNYHTVRLAHLQKVHMQWKVRNAVLAPCLDLGFLKSCCHVLDWGCKAWCLLAQTLVVTAYNASVYLPCSNGGL